MSFYQTQTALDMAGEDAETNPVGPELIFGITKTCAKG